MKVETPVAFIAFNRPHYAKIMAKSLEDIQFRKVYFIFDGARTYNKEDSKLVAETREILRLELNYESVVEISSRRNLGCKRRVISGVSEVFANEESAIFLEDDCIPAEDWFRFAEYMLKKFETDPDVLIISGSNLVSSAQANNFAYGKSAFGNYWGWAGWRKKTSSLFDDFYFVQDISTRLARSKTFENLPRMQRRFWKEVFKHSFCSNHIWDFLITFGIFSRSGLAIYPSENLIQNIGFGKDATHTIGKIPKYVQENPKRDGYYARSAHKLVHDAKYNWSDHDKNVSAKLYSCNAFSLAKLKIGNVIRFILY